MAGCTLNEVCHHGIATLRHCYWGQLEWLVALEVQQEPGMAGVEVTCSFV